MFDLKEKACIVTGASKGIGLGLVQALLRHGAYCLMLDVDYKVFSLKHLLPKSFGLLLFTLFQEGENQARKLQEEFGSNKVHFMRVDVASQANFEAAFEKCLDLYESIDVVVNNAGVEGEINWETQLETNFNVSFV